MTSPALPALQALADARPTRWPSADGASGSGAQLGYARRGPEDGRLRAGIHTPRRHQGQCRPLVAGEDRGGDPADSLRLADCVDLDDLAIGDREGKDGVW